MMKAAVGEGSAQPFMKEEKEQGDLNPFRREAKCTTCSGRDSPLK
jgi:hypothetical protein